MKRLLLYLFSVAIRGQYAATGKKRETSAAIVWLRLNPSTGPIYDLQNKSIGSYQNNKLTVGCTKRGRP